jgi:GT2 family glycosyltransferase
VTASPAISVVTMAWRNEDHAAAFVESLAAAAAGTAPPQVVLVVNGPEGQAAGTAFSEAAARAGLDVTTVTLGTNTGFSGGADAGVEVATGEIVVVANLDLTFNERFLAVLGEEAAGGERWDFLAPAVRQGAAGADEGVSRRTRSHRLAWVGSPPPAPAPVPAGNGACLVLRRATLERRVANAGALFDPEYHSFNEDIDLFWWAARRGLVVRYVPDLRVTHALAGSFAGGHRFRDRPPDVQRRVMANYRVTVWKNAAGARDWLGWVLGEAVYGGQAAVYGRLGGVRRYAASWPESIRVAAAIRRRRGTLRPSGSRPA